MAPPELYVVCCTAPGFLGIMPHPAPPPRLSNALQALRSGGVELLVTLLEDHECKQLGLGFLARECARQGIEHLAHPVEDMAMPTDAAAFAALALDLKHRFLAGTGIAVHCRAGIGRSGLLAASVLVALGKSTSEAFAEVSRARGATVPEVPAQGRWLELHQQALTGK